ncbi:AAA family ATPase [Cellulomonas sp. APG4]|uniref:AAA family ATPase n=1 Tax=Cellulomonas sp. APG4 TaxID=1538656 RepID=UPI00137A890B|nr:AAA family ATPase [Cellulomonas sp. APG4]NCT91039.1 AAA family ATPase [Cellulomonas sp. APG4]
MYLHRMTLQALGPFAGTHTIDFARLGASGLFLLEGPTGAGKSTIIDAVVFALYGKVASKDASEERLRSGHAAPEDETFVDLVLETRAGIHRVRRTPAYRRPKQRGTGTTLQQAGVRLWRLADPDRPDEGELVSARLDEAGAELQRIIGLDRTQFVQTVVLPQGEFAGFLRANPEDRRGVLQRVFGTEVYEQLQQRLERMRAESGRELDQARAALERSVARFVGAADPAEEDAAHLRTAAASAEGADLDARVRSLADALSRSEAEAQRTARRARADCVERRTALDTARRTAESLARRARLRADLAALEERDAGHTRDAARCEVARRAQAVLPVARGLDAARATVTEATATAERLRAAAPVDLAGAVDPATEVGVQRKNLAEERDRCTALQGALHRLVDVEAGLAGRREQLRSAQDSRAELTERLDVERARLAARPAERAEVVAQVERLSVAADGLGPAQEKVRTLELRRVAAREAEQLAAEVTEAEAGLARAAEVARVAIDHAAEVQRARVAGIAGELASRLVTGEPCLVCGGTDHPAPAPLDPAHVTTDEVEEAERLRTLAQDALGSTREELVALRERLTSRRAAAGGSLEEVEALLGPAGAEVAAAERAGVEHRAAVRTLADHDAATAALERVVAELAAELAAAAERVSALREALTSDEVEVEAARAGSATVAERSAELDARVEIAGRWLEALGRLEDAGAQVAAREVELDAMLGEHGFDALADAVEAHLDPAELNRLEELVRSHRSALDRVRANLAELAELPEDLEVDVEAAEEAHAVADAAATAAAEEAARRSARAHAARSAADEVVAALGDLRVAHAKAGPVVRMANLAAASGADNGKQLTLATYVLVRRFEDVVAAANARLGSMSDGRYELVRSDEREAVRARRTGLAMKVVDHHLELERDPRTLSGGETFYVSLCLALGLADVVTAEAGGTDLGTLFVDEGFGSLDPQTLDGVLAELGRLREGGRVVGVVSHVDTLKQSIAERIEVRRTGRGVSTLAVRA